MPTLKPLSLNDLLDSSVYIEEKRKFDINPLVFSVAAKRTNKFFNTAGMHVTDEDYEEAARITEHFSKKFLWKTLQGINLSPFRERTCLILSKGADHEYSDRDIGLLVKLPWLYEEDLMLEEFSNQFNMKTFTAEEARKFKGNTSDSIDYGKISLTFLKFSKHWAGHKSIVVRWWYTDGTRVYSTVPSQQTSAFSDVLQQCLSRDITIANRNLTLYNLDKYNFITINKVQIKE